MNVYTRQVKYNAVFKPKALNFARILIPNNYFVDTHLAQSRNNSFTAEIDELMADSSEEPKKTEAIAKLGQGLMHRFHRTEAAAAIATRSTCACASLQVYIFGTD